jgi:hypothetical protein
VALTPTIESSQAAVRVLQEPVGDILASQATVRALINYPTPIMEASQSAVRVLLNRAPVIEVSQAVVRVLALGRIEDPIVRAWTFTLDGHDFYVLRLGDAETLIFDMATEQWVNWDSHRLAFWRVNCGINWIDGQSIGFEFNSSIIVGDDQQGLLWALDPEQSFDDAVRSDVEEQQVVFPRILTGQVAMTGRQVLPCYAIFLIGDNFGPLTEGFTAGITLEYSDDAGKTYDSAGTITVTPSTVDQSYEWLSLGQIEAPGRIFRLTDTGVFTRIDSMTMNDD